MSGWTVSSFHCKLGYPTVIASSTVPDSQSFADYPCMLLAAWHAELLNLRAGLPFLVAVRGRVYSAAPKKCELSDKLAVVHEVQGHSVPSRMGITA